MALGQENSCIQTAAVIISEMAAYIAAISAMVSTLPKRRFVA